MSELFFLPTKHGKKLLVYQKHFFHSDRRNNGRSYWKCKDHNTGCKARVILIGDEFHKLTQEHNHPPDNLALLQRKFKELVKEKVRQEGGLRPVTQIYKEEAERVAAISKDLAVNIPPFRNMKGKLYRARKSSRLSLVNMETESLGINFDAMEALSSTEEEESFSNRVATMDTKVTDDQLIFSTASTSSILSMNTNISPSIQRNSSIRYGQSLIEDGSMNIDDPLFSLENLANQLPKSSTTSVNTAVLTRKGLLERLKENVVIGDGGFVFSLEKRGYVKAGPWTPEAAVEHPDAVRSLHREFLRAGSDVMQAFTFYASDDKLINRGNEAGKLYSGNDINEAACKIAREVAEEGDALVAGGISQTPTYLSNKGKAAVQAEFRKQIEVFTRNKVDFLICEYFEHIEEIEWAIQVCKETHLPVAATMCIGSEGDLHGVSAGDCAVRMAKAGADVVGLNCHFDPFKTLETIAIMKKSLDAQGLKVYLMTQPLAFHTPDASKQGFIDSPEFPFALEPRVCTRWDMHRYARKAYELGVRYIGGCCGFESYHIRAVSEELAKERGKTPESSKKHEPWGEGLKMHTKPWVRARARKDYWQNLNPSTGRPFSAAFSKPDNWGVTAGSEDLKQKAESTTQEELQKVFNRSAK